MNPTHEIQSLRQQIAELEAELETFRCHSNKIDEFINKGDRFIWILTNNLKFSHIDIDLRISGFSPDELLGTHISDFLTKESFEILKKSLKIERTIIKNDNIHDPDKMTRIILEGVTKTDNKIWYEAKLKYLLDNGEPGDIIMYVRDITSQKKIEDMFNKKYENREIRSKLLLETASEILPISIFVYNLKTRKSWEQEKKIYKYLGYSKNEWDKLSEGKEFAELILEEDKEKLEAIFDDLVKNRSEVESGEFRIKDKFGNIHIFYTKITPLTTDNDGNIVEVMGFDYDVTYIKNLEKEIKELKKNS